MKITAKLFVALLACCAGAIQANHNEYDYASESRGCCFSSCYECGCNPLYCGAWDLQIQAGVNPIKWRNRGNVLSNNCEGSLLNPIFVAGSLYNFKHYYKTPWIVGGQVGYHWTDNVRAYVEFNYSQAKAKGDAVPFFLTTAGTDSIFVSSLTKYKVFDAYVGARYYWDRWCDRVAFFLGAKVGLTHHKSIDATFFFTDVADVVVPAFASNNVVSGGADFGLDICFCGNWSFVVTGSVLASCAPSAVGSPVTVVSAAPENTQFVVFGVGTELRFPVTAGIRYSF
jgi:hypothetical protein